MAGISIRMGLWHMTVCHAKRPFLLSGHMHAKGITPCKASSHAISVLKETCSVMSVIFIVLRILEKMTKMRSLRWLLSLCGYCDLIHSHVCMLLMQYLGGSSAFEGRNSQRIRFTAENNTPRLHFKSRKNATGVWGER